MGASIKPCVTSTHDLDLESIAKEVMLVDVRDLEFAPGRRLDVRGDIADLLVIKVKSGDGIVAARSGGLFFDAHRTLAIVELNHALPFGVVHVIGKYRCTRLARIRVLEQSDQVMAMKNIVTKDQCAGIVANELASNNKSLCQTIG